MLKFNREAEQLLMYLNFGKLPYSFKLNQQGGGEIIIKVKPREEEVFEPGTISIHHSDGSPGCVEAWMD